MSVRWVEDFLQDFRFAVRQLWKAPGFAITSIVTLATGLCGSVAVFAFVDAALLKPLPYRDPARLIGVFESIPALPQSDLSYPDYLDWKKLNKSSIKFSHRSMCISGTTRYYPRRKGLSRPTTAG